MKKFPSIDHFPINPPSNNYEELTSYHVLSSIVYHDFTYYSDKERSYERKRERNLKSLSYHSTPIYHAAESRAEIFDPCIRKIV